jgi:hypothetical protein
MTEPVQEDLPRLSRMFAAEFMRRLDDWHYLEWANACTEYSRPIGARARVEMAFARVNAKYRELLRRLA